MQTRDGRSYTDFTQANFECGKFKLLSEINGEEKPSEGSDEIIRCGSTIITDRWMVGASHCFDMVDQNIASSVGGREVNK